MNNRGVGRIVTLAAFAGCNAIAGIEAASVVGPGDEGAARARGGGEAGSGGAGGAGGTGGSAGASGQGGAAGAAMRAPPRGSIQALQAAIDSRKYTEENCADLNDSGKTKWNCFTDPDVADPAHEAEDPGTNVICSTFKLADLNYDDYKDNGGWPTDAASMKEIRDRVTGQRRARKG